VLRYRDILADLDMFYTSSTLIESTDGCIVDVFEVWWASLS
jgi:hypothetical protein